MESRVIVGQRIGRLGNQIYLLAHLLALHQATGIGFSHPALGAYGLLFRGTAFDPLVRHPKSHSSGMERFLPRTVVYSAVRLMDKAGAIDKFNGASMRVDYREIVDMSDPAFLEKVRRHSHFWLFGGWLFRYPLITSSFFPEARRFFDLCEPYASNVKKKVAQARRGTDILVGVHIRQTDFKDHVGGKFYFTTAEYAKIMKNAMLLFSGLKTRFLIVSDERQNPQSFVGLDYAWGNGVPVEDMYALGFCDYVISSMASSFSLWPTVLYQVPNYRVSDPQAEITLDDFKVRIDPWEYKKSSQL